MILFATHQQLIVRDSGHLILSVYETTTDISGRIGPAVVIADLPALYKLCEFDNSALDLTLTFMLSKYANMLYFSVLGIVT